MNLIANVAGKVLTLGARKMDYGAALAGSAGYVLLYILLDWLSYVQPVLKLGITPWNPQAGLTVAFLVIFGPRWAPMTAGAVLLSELLVRQSTISPLVAGVSIWIALAYGLLALLLRRWKLTTSFRTLRMSARFAAASVGATLVIAAGYMVLFISAGELPAAQAGASFPRLWIGDLTGIVTLTPLLIGARDWRDAVHTARQHPWEVLVQFAALMATLWVVFDISATDQVRFFYPLFIPVIWVALRWGLSGAMIAALTIQIGLIVAAQDESRAPPLIDLQFLMLTLSLTGLLLGAVVTERADVLRRVAMSEAEQRALLAMAPDAVLTVDRAGDVRMANPAALRLFGDAAAAPGTVRLPDLLPSLSMQGQEGRTTLEGRRAGGTAFPAEIAWARIDAPANEGFLVTVRDATERRRADAQLRERDIALARAMRFAVAGELASALAHELNQPITALVSYLNAAEILAAPFGAQEQRLTSTLGKAAQEAIRASEVLRRLRDFYRGGALKYEDVQIQGLCTTVAAAYHDRLRRAGVSFTMQLDSSLPTLKADATQLEIVLHNLISNAIDAVNQVQRPWRRIELNAARAGDCAVVRVEDSGVGIEPQISAKLFEPFVTSKPDGMGLGLAISRSLVRARGGDLSCERSDRLRGACFIVRIPIGHAADDLS
jgi:signal transduction histidine kinase